jgi:hypothetical protein
MGSANRRDVLDRYLEGFRRSDLGPSLRQGRVRLSASRDGCSRAETDDPKVGMPFG